MRLSGWWRLWIVLTAIYGAVVTIAFVSMWPSVTNIPHGPWLEYRMSTESRQLLQRRSPLLADLMEALRQADKVGDVERATVLAQEIRAAREKPWTLDPIVVKVPNGHSFNLPADSTEEEVAAFTRDYMRIINAEAANRHIKTVKALGLLLIGPPGLLLILGLLVVWKWRGFQRDRVTP